MKNGNISLARMVKSALAILALTAVLWFVTAVAMAQPADAPRSGSAKAHVVVQFGDHDLAARAISFTATISGLGALNLTGLSVVTSGTGAGTPVCSIGGVGCPASDCFCQCPPPYTSCIYWNYNYWDGSTWQLYGVGPGSSTVNDGAVEGWRWGAYGSAMQPARPITAAVQALAWLGPLQSLTDGGYGSDGATAEAQLAVGANDYSAAEWQRQSTAPSLLNYQMMYASRFASQGSDAAGKLSVAQVGARACWTRNTRQPSYYYNSGTGTYSTDAGPLAWAMLGTVALSQTGTIAGSDISQEFATVGRRLGVVTGLG